jgi:hypothetical protein
VNASQDARDGKDDGVAIKDPSVDEERSGVGGCWAIIFMPRSTEPIEGVEEVQVEDGGYPHLG